MMRLFLQERAAKATHTLLAQELLADKMQPPLIPTP
jgi:hypothetical protein